MPDLTAINARSPTYHGSDAAYLLPNDSVEHERLQSQHAALLALLDNRLIHAPLHSPKTLLDVGCGTGLMTYALSDMYPTAANVYGVDLSPVPIQQNHRSHLSFVQGDIHNLARSDPRLESSSFDFIFNRLLICGITDWPRYMRVVLQLLKPGGWTEMQDFNENIYLSDQAESAAPSDSWIWLRMLREDLVRRGLDPDAGVNLRERMLQAGFVDVDVTEFRIPFSRSNISPAIAAHYVGDPWGHHWRLIQTVGKQRGLPEEEIKKLQMEMQKCLREEEGKYQSFYVAVGRKPDV